MGARYPVFQGTALDSASGLVKARQQGRVNDFVPVFHGPYLRRAVAISDVLTRRVVAILGIVFVLWIGLLPEEAGL